MKGGFIVTPKRYLEQIQVLEAKIDLKRDQIIEERTRAQSCTTAMSERVQTSPCSDSLANIITRICDFEKDMANMVNELIDLKQDSISKIDKMNNPDYVRILMLRYFKGYSLMQIANEMNYSYSHIKRKHGWALEEFKRYMNDGPQ